MQGSIGITGSPGTGKKSVAPLVAGSLGLPCIGLNEFAKTHGMIDGSGEEAEVDVDALSRSLAKRLATPSVIFGHLLPYSVGRRLVSMAVVLRCEPSVLKQRLMSRGYPEKKILENVEAELIGTISADTRGAYGSTKTIEIDSTYTTPQGAAVLVVSALKARRSPGAPIDWLANYDSGPRLRSLLPPG